MYLNDEFNETIAKISLVLKMILKYCNITNKKLLNIEIIKFVYFVRTNYYEAHEKYLFSKKLIDKDSFNISYVLYEKDPKLYFKGFELERSYKNLPFYNIY